jgi:tetratricopeptide (TPR) repeat protein
MTRLPRTSSITLAALAICSLATTAFGGQNAAAEAEGFFNAKDWSKAAVAYQAIASREPANGTAWFRLGLSEHELGRYAKAAEALERATTLAVAGAPPFVVEYRLARAYARAGERGRSLDALAKAVEHGFAQPTLIASQPDLEPLRGDPRYAEIYAAAEKAAYPCRDSAEFRAFDFWVGRWDVYVGDRLVGTNDVERILDGCVVFENWQSTGTNAGKSFNFFDASTKRWRQLWIDNSGNVLELAGTFENGEMRFEGETPGTNGAKTLHKLTFTPMGEGRVRQHWQQSTDGGKTWADAFDGLYVPRKAA